MKPGLFQELRQEFQGLPSENNLRFWLIKRQFTPDAAGKAASTYLSTMRLVGETSGEYIPPSDDGETQMLPAVIEPKAAPMSWMKAVKASSGVGQGLLQEVFNLEEGPVTLTYPASLTEQSFEDLSDYLQLFLRKAKRRVTSTKEEGNEGS